MKTKSAAFGNILLFSAAFATVIATASICLSQQASPVGVPRVHYNSAGLRSPGFLGQQRLQMGGPVQGYYQPVLINGPYSARMSMAFQGSFTELRNMPNIVGLLIGNVYRFRITNIPLVDAQGKELYPTLEVIDRLYAPAGKEVEHPIVVEITTEDVKAALAGNLVTKVIYLEDPDNPIDTVNPPNRHQEYMDVSPAADPVAVADTLGRPMAILRIGGRVPVFTPEGLMTEEFQFGSPSFIDYRTSVPAPRKSTTTFPAAKPAEKAPAAENGAAELPEPEADNPPENEVPDNADQFDNIEF